MQLGDSVTVSAPIEKVFDGWAALERSPEHQKPTIERTRLLVGISVGVVVLALGVFGLGRWLRTEGPGVSHPGVAHPSPGLRERSGES